MHGRHREYHVFSKEARDALRGETVDLGIFDEVRTQRNYETWAALEPTTTARPQPLILRISTAGDDRSVLLRDWWERGRRIIDGAEAPRGFGMTWYAADDELRRYRPMITRASTTGLLKPIRACRGPYQRGSHPAGVANSTGPQMVRGERLNLWTDAAMNGYRPVCGALDRRRSRLTWREYGSLSGSMPYRHGAGSRYRLQSQTDAGTWAGVAGELDSAHVGQQHDRAGDAQELIEQLCEKWKPSMLAVSASHPIAPYVGAAGLAPVRRSRR